MNVLAFDTCFGACSTAILTRAADGEVRRATRFEPMTKGHAEALFPMIDAVMAEAGAGYGDLDAIAVTVGPGTFTGTRVGIAAARGLALATGLPVYGTTSLAAIAGRALRSGSEATLGPGVSLLVCHDARRGQLYTQRFTDLRACPLGSPAVQEIEAAAAEAEAANVAWVIGTGAAAITAVTCLPIWPGPCDDGLPDAESLLDIWLERLNPPNTLYLRPPDAKPQSGDAIPRAT